MRVPGALGIAVQHRCGHADFLNDNRQRAGVAVIVRNRQRYALTAFADPHDDKLAGLRGSGNER